MVGTFKLCEQIHLAHTGKQNKNKKTPRLWRETPDLTDDLFTVWLVNCLLPTTSGFLNKAIFSRKGGKKIP